MIYLHYKDTKTFGHSFSFPLIFKTLRTSYLQVGNFSIISRFLQRTIIDGIKNINEYSEIKYSGYSLIFSILRSRTLAFTDEWIVCF